MTEQAIADARIQIRLGLAQIMVALALSESHLPRAVQTLDKGLFEGKQFFKQLHHICARLHDSLL